MSRLGGEVSIMCQRPDGSVRSLQGVGRRLVTAVLVAASLASAWSPPAAGAAPAQRRFESLEEATGALIDALRAGDQKALAAIFGEDARRLLASGDPVADTRARDQFVAAYGEQHRLEGGGGKVVLFVGKEDFPFPIPLVPDGPSWRFDTAAGKNEVVNRRIGRNELHTIQAVLAYVDAQREYYARDPDRNGLLQYARAFASTPGKRDGLYWETGPGESPSPLGPLVARARSEGYRKQAGRIPYWGYYFRILTAQGKDAPGGAYDYLAQGRMIGGFALVAYPAQYGTSGVTTFIVNHDGVVYEKNLGPNTAASAQAMRAFNPDSSWRKIADAAEASAAGARAAPADPRPRPEGVAGAVRVRGAVSAIDTAQSTVTLKGPGGRTLTIEVLDKEKLNAVEVGDPVVAEYVEAVIIELKKSGTAAPGMTTRETRTTSKPGETPSGVIQREVSLTGTVIGIDRKARTVSVMGPGGRTETIKARDPKNLARVKVGDLVELTYTRALAVSLDKPPK